MEANMKKQRQHMTSFENTIYKTQLQMEIERTKCAKEIATLKSTRHWWVHRRAQLNF